MRQNFSTGMAGAMAAAASMGPGALLKESQCLWLQLGQWVQLPLLVFFTITVNHSE